MVCGGHGGPAPLHDDARRGSRNTVAVSSSMLGVFRTQQQTREEFLKLIRGSVRDGN